MVEIFIQVDEDGSAPQLSRGPLQLGISIAMP